MDFTLTDDQQLVRDSARALLEKECPVSLVRAYQDDPTAADSLWKHLEDWLELGRGPLVDLCLFLEETGAVLVPGPFFATTVLWSGLGFDGVGTVAFIDDLTMPYTIDADRVDQVAVLVPAGAVVVDASRLQLRPVETIDWTRRLVEVSGSGEFGAPIPVDADRLRERACVALSAELLGTARWLLQHTIAYAKERQQFGRPIGSFQAVQHKIADMALVYEQAWSAVYYAAMTIDAVDADRHRAAHVAKIMAGAAATRCAKDGIQVHGGIGYTWEHDLHLYIRRAYGSEHLFGTADWHRDHLADLLL
ncbi:MAG: mmgC13 [Acidimicrobiales bacterium]|nr:mmgC13 [Acidimicrobiales bacterium]